MILANCYAKIILQLKNYASAMEGMIDHIASVGLRLVNQLKHITNLGMLQNILQIHAKICHIDDNMEISSQLHLKMHH